MAIRVAIAFFVMVGLEIPSLMAQSVPVDSSHALKAQAIFDTLSAKLGLNTIRVRYGDLGHESVLQVTITDSSLFFLPAPSRATRLEEVDRILESQLPPPERPAMVLLGYEWTGQDGTYQAYMKAFPRAKPVRGRTP